MQSSALCFNSAEEGVRSIDQQPDGQISVQSGGIMILSLSTQTCPILSHVKFNVIFTASVLQHLFSCDLDGKDLRSVSDCVERLKLLDEMGRVWGQNMLLQVCGANLLLTDIETKVNNIRPALVVSYSMCVDTCCKTHGQKSHPWWHEMEILLEREPFIHSLVSEVKTNKEY